MKHNKYIFYLLLITISAFLANCNKQENSITPNQGGNIITAAMENSQTKTTLENLCSVLWSNNDTLSLFTNTSQSINNAYTLIEGAGTATAKFAGNPLEGDTHYTYYPYKKEITFSPAKENEDASLAISLQNTFTATANTFNTGEFPMSSTGTTGNILKFNYLCGLLVFELSGTSSITKIKVESISSTNEPNNKLPIAGSAKVIFKPNENPKLKLTSDNNLYTITADCSPQIALSENICSRILITLPPATYPKLKVTIKNSMGEVLEKYLSNVVIEAGKTRTVNTIHYDTELQNAKNKILFSIDNGATWLTELPQTFTTLKIKTEGNSVVTSTLITNIKNIINAAGEMITLDLSEANYESTVFFFGKNLYLKAISFPKNTNEISSWAFSGCINLTGDLIIPNNIVKMGNEAFSDCGFNGKLLLSTKLTKIENDTFRNCKFTGPLTLPTTISSIGQYAFQGCKFTGPLIIPDNIISLGEGAFNNCRNFTSIQFGIGLKTIEYDVFSNCSGMANSSLIIPNNISDINPSAFDGTEFNGLSINMTTIPDNCLSFSCKIKGELNLGEKVKSIGSRAFYGHTEITGNLTIPNSVLYIGEEAFHTCTGFNGTLTIGSQVEKIGSGAFYKCSGFTGTLKIPDSVTAILAPTINRSEGTFEMCSGFTGLIIGKGLIEIPAWTFNQCTNITGSLILESGLTRIETWAFGDCSKLTAIKIKATTPPTLEDVAFANITNTPLYVPANSLSLYKNAEYWKEFTTIIEE